MVAEGGGAPSEERWDSVLEAALLRRVGPARRESLRYVTV